MLDGALTSNFGTAADWTIVIGLMAVAVIMAVVANRLLFAFFRRITVLRHPVLNSLATQARGLTRYALILLVLSIMVNAVPLPADVTGSVHNVFVAAIVILIGWVVLLAANLTVEHHLNRFQLSSADNLLARKAVTQFRILKRVMDGLIVVITMGFALMTFDSVRQFGISLFASAGIAGLVAGMASRPVLSNLFAGLQLALTQPIRLDDVVVVEGEFGRVEEITSTYIVVRIWDLRRMVVPLSYFMEKPFQNWTRTGSQILGTVMLYVDYTAPVERIRAKALEIVKASPLWDKQVANLQVTDIRENTLELRVLVSAEDAGKAWDLRVDVREKLIAFLQAEIPSALPHRRNLGRLEIEGMTFSDGEDKDRAPDVRM